MDVLTTREIQYTDDKGDERNVVLTVYTPYARIDKRGWRGAFAFGPPIARLNGKTIPSGGVDFIQCFMCSVEVARGYLMGSDLAKRVHWHGMRHFGLPCHAERPADFQPPEIGAAEENPGNMDVLTTRTLGCLDQDGATSAIVLTIYKPLRADDGQWTCAFSFGPDERTRSPVRYGTGVDFIESFLDALAIARTTYQTMIAKHASKSEDLLDCADFPFKMGRAFHTDMVGDLGPGAPDFTPSWLRPNE